MYAVLTQLKLELRIEGHFILLNKKRQFHSTMKQYTNSSCSKKFTTVDCTFFHCEEELQTTATVNY